MSALYLLRSKLRLTVLLVAALPAWVGAQVSSSVRPGDRLSVRMFEANMVHQVLVDDRGRVDLPMIGLLAVGTMTPQALQDSVTALYRRFFQPGGVMVLFERRVSILGDVRRPDLHYVDLSVRLRDAIGIAGGVTESGRATEVLLIRDGTRVLIENWRTNDAGNQELRSGDQLVVPREFWFKRNAIPLLSFLGVVGSVIITLLLP